MAKVTVVRAQPVEPPVEKIVLEMTLMEATLLRNFLCNTNVGSPENRCLYGLYQSVYIGLHAAVK